MMKEICYVFELVEGEAPFATSRLITVDLFDHPTNFI